MEESDVMRLGKAVFAMKQLLVPFKALQVAAGDTWSPIVMEAFIQAEKLALDVLRDPISRTAAEGWQVKRLWVRLMDET